MTRCVACVCGANVWHTVRMLTADKLIIQLEAKAAWHEAEASRYRTALDVVSAETATETGNGVTAPAQTPSVGSVSPGGRTFRTDTAASALAVVSAENREWGASEVVAAMEQAGWSGSVSNKVNTVRTALSRLADRGQIERVRHGTYRRLDGPDEPTTESTIPPSSPALNGLGSFAFEEAQT